MATDKHFIDYVLEQIEYSGEVSVKSMFGEYGLFCDGKIVGLVCDNKLFIKPTNAGRTFIKDVVEAPPYPGAKNSFLIEEKLEDKEWLTELITLSVKELLEPKKRKKDANLSLTSLIPNDKFEIHLKPFLHS